MQISAIIKIGKHRIYLSNRGEKTVVSRVRQGVIEYSLRYIVKFVGRNENGRIRQEVAEYIKTGR